MAENETLECITEHERILQEIESTDTACVGPTLRWDEISSYRALTDRNVSVFACIVYVSYLLFMG